jgi:hypothetical protein
MSTTIKFIILVITASIVTMRTAAQNALQISGNVPIASKWMAYTKNDYYPFESNSKCFDASISYRKSNFKKGLSYNVGLSSLVANCKIKHFIIEPFDEKYDAGNYTRYTLPTYERNIKAIGLDISLDKKINANLLGIGFKYYMFGNAQVKTNIKSSETWIVNFSSVTNESASRNFSYQIQNAYYAEDYFFVNAYYGRSIGKKSNLKIIFNVNPLANNSMYSIKITGNTLKEGFNDPNIEYLLNDNVFTLKQFGASLTYTTNILSLRKEGK